MKTVIKHRTNAIDKGLLVFVFIFSAGLSRAQWGNSGSDIYNTNSGNVGIGTSSPIDLLHIEGNNSLYSGMRVRNTNSSGAASIIFDANTGNASMHTDPSSNFAIYQGATPRMYIQNSTGNLGIGTTNPINLLHMEGNNSTYIGMRIRNTNSSGAASIIFDANTGNASMHTDVSSNFAIYQGATPRMYIQNSTGNMGIGSTNPISLLHIEGNNSTYIGMRVRNTNSSGVASIIFDANSGNASMHTDPSSNFAIYQGATPRMYIQNSSGNVGIGTTNPTGGRLDVYDNTNGTGINVLSQPAGTANTYGVLANASNNTTNGVSTGVRGESQGLNSFDQSFGGYFVSNGSGNAGYNVGSYGAIAGSGGLINAGVVGDDGGLGTSPSFFGGYFLGDVFRSGNDNFTSDRRLKENIAPLQNSLTQILKLKPSIYTFKRDEYNGLSLPPGSQMGLIAQELEEVFPDLVKEVNGLKKRGETSKDNQIQFKTVQYIQLIPVLIGAIQELKQQVDDLKAAQSLNATDIKNNSSNPVVVNLSDKNMLVLDQNVPNPFAESTVISYNIPDGFSKAQIIFTNEQGIVVKMVDVIENGKGVLNVFANDLTHGVYSYTLVVDGKIVDSKKMIKE